MNTLVGSLTAVDELTWVESIQGDIACCCCTKGLTSTKLYSRDSQQHQQNHHKPIYDSLVVHSQLQVDFIFVTITTSNSTNIFITIPTSNSTNISWTFSDMRNNSVFGMNGSIVRVFWLQVVIRYSTDAFFQLVTVFPGNYTQMQIAAYGSN